MDDVLGVKINYRYKVSEKTSHKYQHLKECIEGTTNKTDGGEGSGCCFHCMAHTHGPLWFDRPQWCVICSI